MKHNGRLNQIQESLGLTPKPTVSMLEETKGNGNDARTDLSVTSVPLSKTECEELTHIFMGSDDTSHKTLPTEWLKQVSPPLSFPV